MIHARPDYNRIQDPENKIPEDEPVFLLRAQDSIAFLAVQYWAEMNDHNNGDPRLSAMARSHVAKMLAWKKTKPADL